MATDPSPFAAFLSAFVVQAQSFLTVQNVVEVAVLGGGTGVGLVRAWRARGVRHEDPHPRIAALAEKASSQPPNEAMVTVVEGLGAFITEQRRDAAAREGRLQQRVADLERDVRQLLIERDEWGGREAGYQARIDELERRVAELESQHAADIATITRLRTEIDSMRSSLARAGEEAPR